MSLTDSGLKMEKDGERKVFENVCSMKDGAGEWFGNMKYNNKDSIALYSIHWTLLLNSIEFFKQKLEKFTWSSNAMSEIIAPEIFDLWTNISRVSTN